MQRSTLTLRASLSALSLGACLILASPGPAHAADAPKDHAAEWAQHRQEFMNAKLDSDANRLEIKSSQQGAWDEYASARKAFAERAPGKKPDAMDAASITKYHAERATEFARKLTTLAAATAKLQATLSPEQRKTLDQVARRGGHRHGHHGGRHHHRGFRGDDRGRQWGSGMNGRGHDRWSPKPQTDGQPAAK